ncbi:MAG: hypothetical protein RLZZ293_831 [Pseudomonadota bacterium]|jgi:UDP-N-acetylmuramoyl-tripeptide--D-alanyl-D-alanine ligase
MSKLLSGNLVNWCNGVASKHFDLNIVLNKVVIDSRQANEKCLFVAISGENHDGHDYVAEVIERGNFALVKHDYPLELPNLIRVNDTCLALGEIASKYRQQFDLQVVAITGSNGKTTVKEMLKSIAIEQFGADQVLATTGNLNNHLGVPLTLLNLTAQHKVAIIEMGMNHSGELSYLSKLAKPTLAIVNNVLLAHAGHFSSIEEIAQAKAEIYNGLIPNGIACIDQTSPFINYFLANITNQQIIKPYASSSSDCYIEQISPNGANYVTSHGNIKLKLKVLGEHNYFNAQSAIILALNLNCSLEAIKHGLENYTAYSGRLEPKTAFNGALIIDDSYNANPDSVKAALYAIAHLPRPHWFIFADLKELGSFELTLHEEIGKFIEQQKLDCLITTGELAKHSAKFVTTQKHHFAQNLDVVNYCLANLPAQGTLLIKGSNSMRLGEIVKSLSKEV